MNGQQRAAVEFRGRHVLVLAGAGTGKTRTIIGRAAWLISQGVDPSRIQILSFTRKSAGEIVQRVKSMLPDVKHLNGNTFHSWCTGLIKSYPKVFSFSDFTLLEPGDQTDAFKLLLGKDKVVIQKTRMKPSVFRDVYSFAINTRCSLSEAIRKIVFDGEKDDMTDKLIEENRHYFAAIIRKYQEYKLAHRQLDYDDILQSVVSVLSKDPEARRYVASRYEHILVDEMQDTNPLQWSLLEQFIPWCHLFCVGDDAQSIYAFRGADFRNVHSFKDRVPDSEILKLEENYRSTQEILDVSNWLLRQSPLDYDKELRAVRGSGEKPLLKQFHSDWDEANWVADDILRGCAEDSKSYMDHMVLSRTVRGLRTLETVLIERKIPYQVFGGIQLLESAHIRDLLSALKVVSNIRDEISWARFLCLWPGIGEVTAARFINDFLDCGTIEDCIGSLGKRLKPKASRDSKTAGSGTGRTSFHPAVETLMAVKDLNAAPSEAIDTAFRNMEWILSAKYAADWKKRSPDFPVLSQIAKSYPTVNEFIVDFVLDPSLNESFIKDKDTSGDVVTLSTIHSAKGLEADTCYVLNVSPGMYPMGWAIAEGFDAVEEERRCLYVALTRARNRLVVTRNLDSLNGSQLIWNAAEGKYVPEQAIYGRAGTPEGIADGDLHHKVESYFFNGLPSGLFDSGTPGEEAVEKEDTFSGKAGEWSPFSDFDFS